MSEHSVSSVGYVEAAEHLYDHLERLSWCIDRLELLRFAAEEAGDSGDTQLRSRQLQALERAVVDKDSLIAAREAGAIAAGRRLPLTLLVEKFDLDLASLHFLIAAALPSLDVELSNRLTGLFEASPERAVHELVELLAFDGHDQAVVMAQAEAKSPLLRHRLLHSLAARGYQGETPLAQRRVSVPERVVNFLRGAGDEPANLFNEVGGHAARRGAVNPSEDTAAVAALRSMLLAQERPLAVVGPAAVGKLTAIAAAARELGCCVIAIEISTLAAMPLSDARDRLADLLRERHLLSAVLVLRTGELAELPFALARDVLAAVQSGQALLTARDATGLVRKLRAPRVVRVAIPPAEVQLRLWRGQLQQHPEARALDPISIVHRYPLAPGDIFEAAQAAHAAAVVERRSLTHGDLVAAARQRVQHQLGDVAELVQTQLSWEDLVLRDDIAQRILEVVAAVRFRDQVLERWGFAGKMPYGRSVTALFSGPPGTGKTMVATLIAKELGLELFRIDLSKVVSKWIGETEKNLGKVFDHAQVSGAVLLFDEADSLFAKRTEVRSSNDRYANLEVNYLLQRLEAFDGIALLTTNHLSSVDPAFLRRIRFRVEFPEPDEHEREALWRSMMPKNAPLADDVNFAELARRFKVSGGYIKNAALRAAFLAAGDNTQVISHELLARATLLEWTELGNLPK